MPQRIVQLTDCHLFADPDQALRGIVTRPRLTAVLAEIRVRFPDAALIVFSGDTAHDERLETYVAVRDELGELLNRVRIVPGNHDQREALREVFPQTTSGPPDRITFEFTSGAWQIIGLDTQRPGELPGSLGDGQLTWLHERLDVTSQNTLLILHHPPVAVGSPWLDRIGLRDAVTLKEIVSARRHVRLICCGHVHQELAATIGGATLLTTPAVGPQFRPQTEELVIETTAGPAFRVIELDDSGTWNSQVLRCRAD